MEKFWGLMRKVNVNCIHSSCYGSKSKSMRVVLLFCILLSVLIRSGMFSLRQIAAVFVCKAPTSVLGASAFVRSHC